MKAIATLVLLFSLINVGQSQNQNQHKKVALIIGVSNYLHASVLHNTLNDAKDMDSVLRSLNFDVKLLLNPSRSDLVQAVDEFGKKITSASVCLFFYSGHGAEYEGENFLFPVTADPHGPEDLASEGFSFNRILGRIENSKIKTSIILLDACRSNPWAKSWEKGLNSYEGLTVINIPNGTFVGYAASPGKVASDGKRKNGTYTEAILRFINARDQSIDQIFNKVNKEVRIQSGGTQIPFKSSSLDGDYYFSSETTDSNKNKNLFNKRDKESFPLLTVNKTRFPMPAIVKGIAANSLTPFADITINKTKFQKDHDYLEIYLSLLSNNIWDKATPVHVSLIKIYKPDADAGVFQYDEQYQPTGLNHRIKIPANLEAGYYKVRIGFFLVSELNTEYPPYYSKTFQMKIQ